MSTITFFEILQHCSGHYLCDPLPNNWEEMNEEEQDSFLENSAWEPLEYAVAEYIREAIEGAAHSTRRFLEHRGITVED